MSAGLATANPMPPDWKAAERPPFADQSRVHGLALPPTPAALRLWAQARGNRAQSSSAMTSPPHGPALEHSSRIPETLARNWSGSLRAEMKSHQGLSVSSLNVNLISRFVNGKIF